MYFPIGWPNSYNAGKQTGMADPLAQVKFNRTRSLFVTISKVAAYLWKTRPRLLLAIWQHDEKSISLHGYIKDVFWNPDSSMVLLVTGSGFLILLDIYEVEKERVYQLLKANGKPCVEQLDLKDIPKIELSRHTVLKVNGGVASVAPRFDEFFVTTGDGLMHRFNWEGVLDVQSTLNAANLQFCLDLDTSVGAPLKNFNGIFISCIECSPVLGGFAIILSDGRGGFLSAPTAEANPSDIVGIFAKDLKGAVCLAVNIKYQLVCYGCANGQALAYTFDDVTGGLILSHKYALPVKDYPDQGSRLGSVRSMGWSPDGCVVGTAWAQGGIAVWSVFGALLMCVHHSEFGSQAVQILSFDWGNEGYELIMIPNCTDSCGVSPGDMLQLHFVKSALSVNPCMPNRQHLFLQGEDAVYLNTGDVMLQTNQGPMICGHQNGVASPSMHFSNKHWQTIQAPHGYINSNWPIRYAAIDNASKFIAVAGVYGYAHFSLARRKWKLFGNETQEKSVTCRGGLTWWDSFLIVGCFVFDDDIDEVRVHARSANLDASCALRVQVASPIFLINTFNNILLVYCADCTVSFYNLSLSVDKTNVSGVDVVKISETSLVEYLLHPVTVTSLSLTALKNEQSLISIPSEGREAHSLIANVAGKVLMLQKDKPISERKNQKVQFLAPVVLASCVENIWYMLNPTSTKQHLEESLWLGCGAQGMQAWLPLFPTREGIRPLGFLSKRIMLHFDLQLYPLAVLFEDAVILGIGSDEGSDGCRTPTPLGGSSMPFPYFSLQRTTQVYLPQILRQLLRRNLGVHALDIARSCTNLPYFTHVLELMLHEVLEKEATASNPIPDPLLPRVVAFIQEFPQYLETVCHCARKTEVALWPHLFSVVGNPIELFKSCHSTGKLDTAASYLIIIQSLEHPSVSRQHATLLLEAALEGNRWELAKDLVRFLTTIGKGENDSPPRTPAYHHKSSFHQCLHSAASLDDSMTAPVMMPLQRQGSRGSSSSSHARPASLSASSREKAGAPGAARERAMTSKERPLKPASLKLSKRDSVEKFSTSVSKSMTVESCEQFYTDLILCRHARKLLSSFLLKDLGKFSAHLEFDLTQWLTKERFRAAFVDDMVHAFTTVHEQFAWPFPKTILPNLQSIYQRTLSQMSGKDLPLVNVNLNVGSGVVTPTTDNDATSLNGSGMGEDIEARLIAIREDIVTLRACESSETGSLMTFDDVDSASDGVLVGEGMNAMDYLGMMQLQEAGSSQARAELRYLLSVFVDARCLDWVIVISLMLFDITSFSFVLERMCTFRDLTQNRLDALLQQLTSLADWVDKECPPYQPLLSTFIANCQAVYETLSEDDPATVGKEKQVTDERIVSRSSSASEVQPDPKERGGQTVEKEASFQDVATAKESSDCVVS